VCIGFSTSGCFFPNTQRWPPPIGGDFETLPAGDGAARVEGIEEVTVLRLADPVRVRPVGVLCVFDSTSKRAGHSQGGCVLGRVLHTFLELVMLTKR
jgi:hypothetical protein